MSRVVPHLPMRSLWLWRGCGAHWPCRPARLALLVEYRADRPALLVLLGALMTEAGDQLDQLNGHARPIDDRFLAWARTRVPGDERGGAGNVAPARRGPGTVDGGERQNVPRES